jgi:hypothetical protein
LLFFCQTMEWNQMNGLNWDGTVFSDRVQKVVLKIGTVQYKIKCQRAINQVTYSCWFTERFDTDVVFIDCKWIFSESKWTGDPQRICRQRSLPPPNVWVAITFRCWFSVGWLFMDSFHGFKFRKNMNFKCILSWENGFQFEVQRALMLFLPKKKEYLKKSNWKWQW